MVELLIVVTVIIVLTSISISAYSGAQKNGRDAKRRAEVDAVAKSMEYSRERVTGVYNYTAAVFTADFPAPPADPKGDTWPNYCIFTSTGTSDLITPPVANITVAPGACPASWTPVTSYLTPTPFPTGTRGWMICARLESSGSYLCKSSLGR